MKAKLTRGGRAVKKRGKCPVCNSAKFKEIERQECDDNGWWIIAKCGKCGYKLGVSMMQEVKA